MSYHNMEAFDNAYDKALNTLSAEPFDTAKALRVSALFQEIAKVYKSDSDRELFAHTKRWEAGGQSPTDLAKASDAGLETALYMLRPTPGC